MLLAFVFVSNKSKAGETTGWLKKIARFQKRTHGDDRLHDVSSPTRPQQPCCVFIFPPTRFAASQAGDGALGRQQNADTDSLSHKDAAQHTPIRSTMYDAAAAGRGVQVHHRNQPPFNESSDYLRDKIKYLK